MGPYTGFFISFLEVVNKMTKGGKTEVGGKGGASTNIITLFLTILNGLLEGQLGKSAYDL